MIIQKNEDFVICIKSINISSQKSSKGKESMIELISKEVGTDEQSVFPVHRLDDSVGGIMVYALNKGCAGKLSCIVADNKMKKRYLAVLKGVPDKKEGILEDLLFKDSSKNKSFVVKRMRKGVKKASLYYNTLSTKEQNGSVYTLVEILLHTGRTHQIRVQFSSRKTPLIGDRRYGSGKDLCPIGLWSYSLEFPNPSDTESTLEFKAEPDWETAPWNMFDPSTIFGK